MKFLFLNLCTALLLLSGCGQTGELVLPPEFDDEKSTQNPTSNKAQ